MWILMLEAGVALFLLVFIVWWTMYPSKKSGTNPRRNDSTQNEPTQNEPNNLDAPVKHEPLDGPKQ